jgi:hypothetical protein
MLMLANPITDWTKKVIALAQDVRYKDHGQLTVTQPLPVAVRCAQHIIHNLVNMHVQQPPHEQWNVVNSFRVNPCGRHGCLQHSLC